MAANDVTIIKGLKPTRTYLVEDRTTSSASATIKPGEPVKIAGTGNNFVALLASGDPEAGTDRFVGIAASESTETSSDDGSVEVWPVIAGETVMRAKAHTASNVDTQSELDGIINDSVTFDLTSSTFTVNEDEGDDPNVHGLIITGGNIDDGTVDFMVNDEVTQHGSAV